MDPTEGANGDHPRCPHCGSTDFYIVGTIGFRRTFDSAAGAFGTYDLLHGQESPVRAECAACSRDVTERFARGQSLGIEVSRLELAHTA